LPGTYAGVFPCEGCPGIASTLWLRSDGRFFFRQRYPADNAREAMDAYSLGRWSSIADDRAIELRGAGPPLLLAQILIWTYVASRAAHFIAYMTAQIHDIRAFCWTWSSLAVIANGRIHADESVLRAQFS
jgi:hypothetical protein